MIRKDLVVTVMLLVIDLAQAADRSKPKVLVRLFEGNAVSSQTLLRAKDTATDILAAAGVRIRWANLRSTPESRTGDCGTSGSVQTIDLRFSDPAPADYKPAALAAASPFAQSGVRITVFYDRVAKILPSQPRWSGQILGHVVAHEIGHVLLGNDSHTQRGLMKAGWSDDDFEMMGVKTLSFTPDDASLIRSNLARACTAGNQ